MASAEEPTAQYPLLNSGEAIVSGYKQRQCGCFWILVLLGGLSSVASFGNAIAYSLDNDSDTDSESGYYYYSEDNIIQGILFICWAIATIWTQIEDRGDYLLLTYGPCRWLLCGMGKEKLYYKNIKHYQISKSCFYGFGLPACTSIKLFNTCSCCCGGSCCGHKTIKLTIKERPQALRAKDVEQDCFVEKCCFDCFCGERADYIGKGCCCQAICNPCNANCCAMNTIFVSTNDPNGLLQVLNNKVGNNAPDIEEQEQYAVI